MHAKLPDFFAMPPLSLSLRLKARTWCALVALITALAFISLVTAAASHHHTTTQETQDCSICSVVSDKIGGGFSTPLAAVTQFFLLFAVAVITLRSSLYVTSELLPPSCGPPATR